MIVMERLPHGYTNRTRIVGGLVEKVYEGPDRDAHSPEARATAHNGGVKCDARKRFHAFELAVVVVEDVFW